ncbi:MarR family winged helix-turn-helix transcriptional regulator [Cryptosporangium phraense]|uniref:MarR family transcriptional regulator n=1 Tax=Cryptosporangium phraense TaxID=2593070 RepID=A0A545AP92_9ACTN|nr:MarR family transcriptional regulator [Cryptosporangium phraense]TQS43149.1 MarR family transcriptional regulator [Cryptosporangium phraense]
MPNREEAAATAQRLRIVFGRLRRRLQDASAVSGLSAPQASALARLALNEPASASQLAGAERVRPQSMAKTIAALHDLGLIRREADPDDGRQKWIYLTDEGRAAAQGARSHREEWLTDAIAQRFTDDERHLIDQALTLLERVVDQ